MEIIVTIFVIAGFTAFVVGCLGLSGFFKDLNKSLPDDETAINTSPWDDGGSTIDEDLDLIEDITVSTPTAADITNRVAPVAPSITGKL